VVKVKAAGSRGRSISGRGSIRGGEKSMATERALTFVALQPTAHVGSPLAEFSSLKMEAIRSYETSANARSTQRHIPQDDILQSLFRLPFLACIVVR
jgi:hypothetical protein